MKSPADLQKCSFNGSANYAFLGYDDCDDGSALYVAGDSNEDPEGGWILFETKSSSGTWHQGPWKKAWETCYGY